MDEYMCDNCGCIFTLEDSYKDGEDVICPNDGYTAYPKKSYNEDEIERGWNYNE